MKISVHAIKELRNKTGVGPVFCKKALEACEGDLSAAEEYLKMKGLEQMVSRPVGDQRESRVFIVERNGTAALAVLSCETDFVASTETFKRAGAQVAELALAGESAERLRRMLGELTYSLKERIELESTHSLSGPAGATPFVYRHFNDKTAAAVWLAAEGEISEVAGASIAMQAAAERPRYLRFADVPRNDLDNRIAAVTEKFLKDGKEKALAKKIAAAKVTKETKRCCLLDQPLLADENRTVSQYAADLGFQVTAVLVCPVADGNH